MKRTHALRTPDVRRRCVMQAIKRVLTVRNRKVILQLPDVFKVDRIEVVVFPYAEEEKRSSTESGGDWREDLLSVSQWESDKDIATVTLVE